MICALMVWSYEFEQLQIDGIGHFGTVLSAFVIWRQASREPYGVLSSATIYLVALCLFHFGLTSAMAFGVPLSEHMEEATWSWIHTDYALAGARLGLVGVASCALGVTLAQLAPMRVLPALPTGPEADRALGRLACAMVVFGVLAWAAILVSRGGLGMFMGSYVTMLEETEGARLATVYLILNIGTPLLAATRWQDSHRYGVAAFAVFAVLGFPLGLRGEVLFPIGAMLVVRARHGYRLGLGRLALAAVLILGATALIRDVRVVGLMHASEAHSISANPIHGVMELGGSIRPVVEVVRWHDQGDDFILGASYFATIDRPVRRVIPWLDRIDSADDERIMNVLVFNRNVGAIGFSPIAEAFRNFGEAGVIAILILYGLLIGRLDQLPLDPTWTALVGVMMVPLLNQVRNSFMGLPSSAAAGVVLVLVVTWYYGSSPARGSAGTRAPEHARNA